MLCTIGGKPTFLIDYQKNFCLIFNAYKAVYTLF